MFFRNLPKDVHAVGFAENIETLTFQAFFLLYKHCHNSLKYGVSLS